MNRFSAFWPAFWEGLAASVMLHAASPTYSTAGLPHDIGQSFAGVGATMGRSFASVRNSRDTHRAADTRGFAGAPEAA